MYKIKTFLCFIFRLFFLQIVAACLLAVASATHLSHWGYAPLAYHAAHVPVLDAHGFQLDTPDVAHAKAAHFAAHAEARARTGHHGVYGHAYAPLAYAGHHGYHIPVLDHNGYQLDTPEVAHAKAAHFAAHAEAASRGHYRKRRGILSYAGHHGYHVPVLDHNGFQLDTPEVAHAKAAHAAAHVEANARTGHAHYAAPLAYAHHGVVAPVAYATHGVYHGPQHIPVIGPHGVPLDTPEVAHARAAHLAAHADAHVRSGYAGYHGYATHGYAAPLALGHHLPLDTPEVAAAKAHHAAAHAEALARNHHHH